jgi:hypothetical protein
MPTPSSCLLDTPLRPVRAPAAELTLLSHNGSEL